MKVVLLDGMETDGHVSKTIKDIYSHISDDLSHFKLKDMHVEACRSCGSCGHKNPGECVFKDDIKVIFKELVRSDLVVMLSPIRFGGYSSHLKKVVDKFMLLGLPLYMVSKGHLLHPPRYGKRDLMVIGVKEKDLQGQEKSFKVLAENNALNLLYTHKTVILDSSDTVATIKDRIESLYDKEAIS